MFSLSLTQNLIAQCCSRFHFSIFVTRHYYTHLHNSLSSWNLHWSSSMNVCLSRCLRCGYSFASCRATHSVSLLSWRTAYIHIYIYIYGEKKNHYTKDPNCFQGISVEKDFEMSVTELVDYGYITVCIYRSHDSNLWTFLKKSWINNAENTV